MCVNEKQITGGEREEKREREMERICVCVNDKQTRGERERKRERKMERDLDRERVEERE